MPENTVIVAYRNRPESLSSFLSHFATAASAVPNPPRLVICSVHSTDLSRPFFQKWRRTLPPNISAKWLEVKEVGKFNKSKALNTCLRFVETPMVTMLDIDAMMSGDFFSYIDDYYRQHPIERKLCHRVRCFGAHPHTNDFAEIQNQLNRYRIAKEWFHVKGKFKSFKELKPEDHIADLFERNALGNSHYTCSLQQVLDMGGYNYNFVGWGWEDVEFNQRYWTHYRNGTMIPRGRYLLMNRSHQYCDGWNPKQSEKDNLQKLHQCRACGFPKPIVGPLWSWNDSELEDDKQF